MAGPAYLCLSFAFTACAIFAPTPQPNTLRKTHSRGCTLSEWVRATTTLGTAVGRPFSISPYFCNEDFCYKFPKLLNRFRPTDTLPDPPDVKCVETWLNRGTQLLPLGSPDGEHSVFLPYSPRRPLLNSTGDLRLCMNFSLLPAQPFNHTFIKAPLTAKALPEPDDREVLRTTRESSHIQGQDPMSRQFADVLIGIGVDQVNTQKYKEAIKTFNLILGKAGVSAAVLVGRGTALALAGMFDDAVLDYERALELEPKMLDGWQRLAQARMAMKDFRKAAEAYTRAIDISKGQGQEQPGMSVFELLYSRATCYSQAKDTFRAIKDLKALLKLKPDSPDMLLTLGQMLVQQGDPEEAVEVLTRATRKHNYYNVMWIALAAAHEGVGDYPAALGALQKAIQADPGAAASYRTMASLQLRMGDPRSALKSVLSALKSDSTSVESSYIKGTCHHLLGDLASAVQEYESSLHKQATQEDQHFVFQSLYQRELAAYQGSAMNWALDEFDVNAHFPAIFKESWATVLSPMRLVPAYQMQGLHEAMGHQGTFPTEHLSQGVRQGRKDLVKAADALGAVIFSLSSGQAPDKRLMRASGMAAIEIAQALKATAAKSSSSKRRSGREEEEEEGSTQEQQSGLLGWRDMFNRAMRWTSLCNPMAAYVWVDDLTEDEFQQGFGITSTIVSGHVKSPQYYPQLMRAVTALKDEILDSGQVLTEPNARGIPTEVKDLDPSIGPKIEEAESCKDLWKAVKEDFVVLTPCYSAAKPKHILNGTMLAINKLQDDGGYQFSLRSMNTPERFQDYDRELSAAFKSLVDGLSVDSPKQQKVTSAALKLAFYWYNLFPLAHGTPLVGHVGLVGSLLAADLELTKPAKAGKQLDWEAMLTPELKDFSSKQSPWIQKGLKPFTTGDLIGVLEAYPTVSSAVQLLDIYS